MDDQEDDVMGMGMGMGMGYKRVQRGRGFRLRLNSRRFSVQRLRARFVYYIRKVVMKWKRSGFGVGSLKRGFATVSSCTISRRGLILDEHQAKRAYSSHHNTNKFKSFARSNSFYSEAIADCLEFIKRSSSVSVDDQRPRPPAAS